MCLLVTKCWHMNSWSQMAASMTLLPRFQMLFFSWTCDCMSLNFIIQGLPLNRIEPTNHTDETVENRDFSSINCAHLVQWGVLRTVYMCVITHRRRRALVGSIVFEATFQCSPAGCQSLKSSLLTSEIYINECALGWFSL